MTQLERRQKILAGLDVSRCRGVEIDPLHAPIVSKRDGNVLYEPSTCRRSGLRLYEHPPKRPQINGAVERCNGSWRYEFYASYGLPRSVEGPQPHSLRLLAPLQPSQALRRSCRTNPGRAPQIVPSTREPVVSYVLIPDIRLQILISFRRAGRGLQRRAPPGGNGDAGANFGHG